MALISRVTLHDLVNLNVFVFSYVCHPVVLDTITRKINCRSHNCISCADSNFPRLCVLRGILQVEKIFQPYENFGLKTKILFG